MEQLDVTWSRALKCWWSFVWRGFVLSLLILVPLELVAVLVILPMLGLRPGHPPGPGQVVHKAGLLASLWLVIMIGMVLTQTAAMRWMLRRARWSDFKVLLASNE